MNLREIFCFEFAYQARQIRTWLYFAVLFAIAFLLTRNLIEDARNGGVLANSPSVIAFVTSLCNMLWLLIATAVAGDSAARDAQTRMHPLIYTSPISEVHYLGGRFLAALALNAVILLMVPAGMLLAVLIPGVEPEILGPFELATYISTYVFFALPTAFVATAIQFSLATLNRRAITSYLGGILLFVVSIAAGAVANLFHLPTLGKLLDPIHYVSNGIISKALTPIEKNTRLIVLDPSVLLGDLLWVSIAIGVLIFTRLRFRFGHYTSSGADRKARHNDAKDGSRSWGAVTTPITDYTPVYVARAQRSFGLITHTRQVFAIAWTSFETIIKSGTGLVLVVPLAILGGLLIPLVMDVGGVPLLPTTAQVITVITAPIADSLRFPWVLIPLIIIFYAGELVWRERDARLSEIADTFPVPEWVRLLGGFAGLGLVLFTWMVFLTAAGMLSQIRMGYFDFEIWVYLRAMFGMQLIDWLLFAALVFAVHVVVNQKQVGYLLALLAYGFIAFASRLGVDHRLLVYTSDPGWRYSDMRAFGNTVVPWFWFKAYWLAWGLMLAVAVKLLCVRGLERSIKARLREARRRFTRSTVGMFIISVTLILSIGGYIFYNTNVLNKYETAADQMKRSAAYERQYGKYKGIAQPSLRSTSLRIDIYPERREAKIQGTYILANTSSVEIDSIHVTTARGVQTSKVSIDRSAVPVIIDDDLDYRVYSLKKPLQPGESLRLSFEVQIASKGFRNNGADALIVANGTCLTNQACLPGIGYQRNRELNVAEKRKQYGLGARAAIPSFDNSVARRIPVGGEKIAFNAIVGTSADQIAVAPGVLRGRWAELDRRYFHYLSDDPVNNEYSVFSARYALHEEKWIPTTRSGRAVAIQIYHDPMHIENLIRMARSVQASLSYHTKRFGPYPHKYVRLIEHPTLGMGVQSQEATIEYGERFSCLNPDDGPRDLYLVFAVLANAVAREWWGMQVVPANVEEAGLLTKSLETYSAMRVVEDTLGPEALQRYLGFMRESYSTSRTRAAPPLIRAADPLAFSLKGPFALYATHEYIGKERVDEALLRLLEKHRAETSPLATSLDLYRELQAVTPDSLQYLLEDLFEKNTFYEFETVQTKAQRNKAGTWQVTLELRARKMVVDEAGVEKEIPMNDWIEIGVYGQTKSYLLKHIVRSGKQTITVTVAQMPERAGIDPRHLLSELKETDSNIKAVKIGN